MLPITVYRQSLHYGEYAANIMYILCLTIGSSQCQLFKYESQNNKRGSTHLNKGVHYGFSMEAFREGCNIGKVSQKERGVRDITIMGMMRQNPV